MEDRKVLEIIDGYRRYFEAHSIPNRKYPHDKFFRYVNDVWAHCHSMLGGIKEFISSGSKEERDRALIRLGFIQGCLAATGEYSVEQLKKDNRPDKKTSSLTHEPLTREDLTEDWEY